MVARVLFQGGANSALRVSLPGYDVNAANIDQTCFDSRWSGFTPYLRGQVTTVSGQTQTVSFGESLDSPPFFVGHFVNTLNGNPLSVFENTPTMLRGGGTDYWYYVQVGPSYLSFQTFGLGGTVTRLTYALFKRPAG